MKTPQNVPRAAYFNWPTPLEWLVISALLAVVIAAGITTFGGTTWDPQGRPELIAR